MEDNKSTNVKKMVKSGITFGSALAMVISYTTWKSVGWAIFHGLLSWVYVIYFLLRYFIPVCRADTEAAAEARLSRRGGAPRPTPYTKNVPARRVHQI